MNTRQEDGDPGADGQQSDGRCEDAARAHSCEKKVHVNMLFVNMFLFNF